MAKKPFDPVKLGLAIVALVLVSAYLFSFFTPKGSGAETGRAGLMMIENEFHRTNSGLNITRHLPDAEIIFTEQKNATTVFKYYYSPSVDKTIVTCDRNATIAICRGRMDDYLNPIDTSRCTIHISVVMQLLNGTF